jgi:carboxyl-terminal processing protease
MMLQGIWLALTASSQYVVLAGNVCQTELPPPLNGILLSSLKQETNVPRKVILRNAATLGVVLLLGMVAQASAETRPSSRFQPTIESGLIARPARGIWRLPNYDTLLDFSGHAIGVYHQAGRLCWRDPEVVNAASVNDLVPYYAVGPSSSTVVFATAPDGTQYRTESLKALPVACTRELDRGAPGYIFEAIAASLLELYPFQREHDVDWAARVKMLRPRVANLKSDYQLRALLAELFIGVADPHTSISGTLDGKSFRIRTFRGQDFQRLLQLFKQQSRYDNFLDWVDKSWMPGQFEQAYALLDPATRQRAFDGGVIWGHLGGDVGYLSINAMAGFANDTDAAGDRALLKPVLDQALQDLKDTRALVLDVSHDLGGDDEVAADIAARFTDQKREAYSKRAYRGGAAQSFQMSPYDGTRYLKPVYLLTSELSASAAEVFTLRMRNLPQVTQVGEPTQGIFSDSTDKGLPNGWTLSLSTEIYRDPRGNNYEGVGLPPTMPYEVFGGDSMSEGYRVAILQAAELARKR